MSLGVLGGQSRRRRRPQVQALGATIPSTCWDKPGFKDCHARMWEVARDACEGGLAKKEYGGNVGTCIDTEANDGAYYGCALRICPPPVQPSPISYGGWTWLSSTPNASIKTFQTHLNTALSREGYKPINADGKLGPATCGAFKTVGGAHPGLFTADPIANLRICQAWTNPTKVGQTKPVSDPVSPIAAELDQKYGQLPWGKPDDRVANRLEGDDSHAGGQHGGEQRTVAVQLRESEDRRAGRKPCVLVPLNFLHLDDQRAAPDHRRIGDDGRAGGVIGVVPEAAGRAGARLDDDRVSRGNQSPNAVRHERDAAFAVLRLARDADLHSV